MKNCCSTFEIRFYLVLGLLVESRSDLLQRHRLHHCSHGSSHLTQSDLLLLADFRLATARAVVRAVLVAVRTIPRLASVAAVDDRLARDLLGAAVALGFGMLAVEPLLGRLLVVALVDPLRLVTRLAKVVPQSGTAFVVVLAAATAASRLGELLFLFVLHELVLVTVNTLIAIHTLAVGGEVAMRSRHRPAVAVVAMRIAALLLSMLDSRTHLRRPALRQLINFVV